MADKYYYVYLFRPPMPGAQPLDGLIETRDADDLEVRGRKQWGYAVYDRELTDKEITQYELMRIKPSDLWGGM